MRISDWSSDVCSSDLPCGIVFVLIGARFVGFNGAKPFKSDPFEVLGQVSPFHSLISIVGEFPRSHCANVSAVTSTSWGLRRTHSHTVATRQPCSIRSEEHTSELQSLMRISYAVFCLKKKKSHIKTKHIN